MIQCAPFALVMTHLHTHPPLHHGDNDQQLKESKHVFWVKHFHAVREVLSSCAISEGFDCPPLSLSLSLSAGVIVTCAAAAKKIMVSP